MTTENLQRSMTEDDRAKFTRGAELLKEMQDGKLFERYWVPVGEGLLAIRRTAMEFLKLKKAKGGHYNNAFGMLCAKTPYAEMHKVVRSNLLYCMEHLADIVELRAGWTPDERAKINHPTSMAQKLKAFINAAPEDKNPRKNASPMAVLKDRVTELERENIDLKDKNTHLERDGGGSLFDLKLSSAIEIARVIVANVTPGKARAIQHELGQAIAAAPKPKKAKALAPAG